MGKVGSGENHAIGSTQARRHAGTQARILLAPRTPHIRIVPHIVDVRHCLYFDVMNRDVAEGTQMSRIAFKSKVVSRSHAEVWTENGQFFIKDTKSSSGTFLNHMRLSPAGVESRAHPLHDGDILQLGVDYQGDPAEINRNWQRSKENPFRQQVMQNIQNAYHAIGTTGEKGAGGAAAAENSNTECCICLYQMAAFQALFVAPCSHCFHFKCIKPILFTSTGFSCPLCRTYADLEANVTIDENDMEVDAKQPAVLQLPPLVLPAGIAQPQPQPQPQAAVDAAVDAVAAAESAAADGSAAAAPLLPPRPPLRDDGNSTPVPSEQPAADSFGSTPVGSMPTNMTQFGSLAGAEDMQLASPMRSAAEACAAVGQPADLRRQAPLKGTRGRGGGGGGGGQAAAGPGANGSSEAQ
ncbi:hypothetical protein BX661DRAFT_198874 [Kickxella alabastrina]|uniref:uncharacterized protein n=1 Tax=Kickxella alabastrina TaxID=61397 RepID=UPI00221F2427|nr:uncharacterized protein BX661DRAFT_198874 [Kickxella alabastrina]KAI7826250.1 hypothetical protein BX661DRAFT_198874 [Kickxella alabastrina]